MPDIIDPAALSLAECFQLKEHSYNVIKKTLRQMQHGEYSHPKPAKP
ncbi:hypothetical protein [Pantoea sp. Ap-967]|nr:hypothetical protein [Pantoea sp. Ap-967]